MIAFRIMHVGWRDVDRQRDAVLVDAQVNLDAVDLLAAIEAAAEAARGRPAGSAVDDDSTRLGGITAGQPPSPAQPVEQAAPQTKPGPAGKQGEQRVERDVAELADGAPLHAAEAETPDRHDRLAQRRPGQRRLRPGPCRLRAVRLHRREFRQNLIHEGIDVTESIPGRRRSLGGSDGGTHILLARRLLTTAADIAHRPPARQPSFTSK